LKRQRIAGPIEPFVPSLQKTGHPNIMTAFRVRISPRPTVIDMTGIPVDDALVIEITFPGDTIDSATGPINVITGSGIAKITVGGETIRGVSLC
jgi:hypothetical protein